MTTSMMYGDLPARALTMAERGGESGDAAMNESGLDESGDADDTDTGEDPCFAPPNIRTDPTEPDATVSFVDCTDTAPEYLLTLNADHPFLYFIHDRVTGAILLAGRFDEPVE